MATYVTRVELHGVYHDHPIYDDLHRYMAAEGFVRYLIVDDYKKYGLPTATYALIDFSGMVIEADNKAQTAANSTRYDYWTLTTMANSWASWNLVEVP